MWCREPTKGGPCGRCARHIGECRADPDPMEVRPLYDDRRWERCMWTAVIVGGVGSLTLLIGLAGWPIVIGVLVLLAAAFARAVGAGE